MISGTALEDVCVAHQLQLDPDLKVLALSSVEARFLYHEIFEQDCYLGSLDPLPEKPTVLDVGANIGLFALRIFRSHPGARVICFEPVAPIFEVLRQNLYGLPAELHPEAVSERDGHTELSYYPLVPGNSSLHARQLTPELLEKMFIGFGTLDLGWWQPLIGRRLFRKFARGIWENPQRFQAEVTSLSSFLERNPKLTVDLLKVDVERAELDVLHGLGDDDWSRVRQIALEATSLDSEPGHLDRIVRLLESRGYDVSVEETGPNAKARKAIEEKLGVDGRVDHMVLARRSV